MEVNIIGIIYYLPDLSLNVNRQDSRCDVVLENFHLFIVRYPVKSSDWRNESFKTLLPVHPVDFLLVLWAVEPASHSFVRTVSQQAVRGSVA